MKSFPKYIYSSLKILEIFGDKTKGIFKYFNEAKLLVEYRKFNNVVDPDLGRPVIKTCFFFQI